MRQLVGDVIRVYIETGRKRTFAGAIDWPGWCRMGTDENSALQALFEIGPRYAAVMQAAQIEFQAPLDPAEFVVVERLEGNATTDFGAPNISPASDNRMVSQDEFLRLQALIMACWQAFDAAVIAGTDRELRKGPKGGGRDLDGIMQHVVGSDASDLARLAWKFKLQNPINPTDELGRTRQATLNAFARAAMDGVPEQGSRSGVIWTPRHFLRNLAWHTLDHAWEIEDRSE
ncbi:MAG: hypothetical protein NTW32_20145 [Chloroflexi bacterium]|nr:hypothetical protein [Chloroflexota bacterium]